MQMLSARYSVERFHHDFRGLCLGLASLLVAPLSVILAGNAHGALLEYRMTFMPSTSSQAIGYTLHIGQSTGVYDVDFDLGSPLASGPGGTVVYALDLEDSTDLFVALSAYDAEGSSSDFSNEIRVSAVIPPPPDPEPIPLPEPVPEPEPALYYS